MDLSSTYMLLGFVLAAYSVVANDSLQVVGTYLSANKDISWWKLWMAASSILIGTLLIGWYANGGDLAYGRLEKIPYPEVFTMWHVIAPAGLLILTRFGLPVSTTFLVLSVFATSAVTTSMVIKSIMGYGVAAVFAFGFWFLLSKKINEHISMESERHKQMWRVAQWVGTGFLFATWIMHDMANIAVYLPRQISFIEAAGVVSLLTFFLGCIFYTSGGKIQDIVLSKTGTRFIRSATIINFVFGFILIIFKEWSSVPMSTTWVFVGLLAGRELAISYQHKSKKQRKIIFPMLRKDFGKIVLGLLVSIGIALAASSSL